MSRHEVGETISKNDVGMKTPDLDVSFGDDEKKE